MKKILKFADIPILLLIIFLIICFILFPFLKIFISGFFYEGYFTLEGFQFLSDGNILLYNSLYTGIFTTVITVVVSVSIGIFCYIYGCVCRKIISFILMITMISPPFVSSLAYIKLFGRRGFITHEILNLSFDAYGLYGVVLMQSIGLISLGSLIIISSLDNIDKAQINSARSFGAETGNIISDILLTELFPSIKTVAILSFIRSISDFSTPLIIGGAFETLASESYITFISEGNVLKASAMNILLCIPVLFIFVFYMKNLKIIEKNIEKSDISEFFLEKKGKIFYFIAFLALLFLFFLFLQYGSIILSAFTDYRKGKMYFTFEHFAEIGDYIDKTVFRSVYYSLIGAFSGSVLGMLLQYYIIIRNKSMLKIFDFIGTMPYIFPGIFFGIGYILAFNDYPLQITGTSLIVILNMTFRQLPFSIKIFGVSMGDIDKSEILSGKDLGAGEFYIFKDIILPNSVEKFIVSMMNNFNGIMTTVGTIIFLVRPNQKVLTLVMFDAINSGKYNIASVIALIIIVICFSFNVLFSSMNIFLKIRRKYVSGNKKSDKIIQ
ncbi:iron ABC transporter permease [Leptotrichia sp. OH3620_COT-345]|uniref:ABC transporter permease n=1 Tax=Leptotrichia sp. OH3620_COT-345 TaxID=2491048 RepID=UPI000F64E61C|nr:ABC transporter permease subunit [Leptotrichia sp. OH3620_COT-345]RRD39596.1 iron ABC transporter permease [Leptotrichia sp. OH3620_COT-345]